MTRRIQELCQLLSVILPVCSSGNNFIADLNLPWYTFIEYHRLYELVRSNGRKIVDTQKIKMPRRNRKAHSPEQGKLSNPTRKPYSISKLNASSKTKVGILYFVMTKYHVS